MSIGLDNFFENYGLNQNQNSSYLNSNTNNTQSLWGGNNNYPTTNNNNSLFGNFSSSSTNETNGLSSTTNNSNDPFSNTSNSNNQCPFQSQGQGMDIQSLLSNIIQSIMSMLSSIINSLLGGMGQSGSGCGGSNSGESGCSNSQQNMGIDPNSQSGSSCSGSGQSGQSSTNYNNQTQNTQQSNQSNSGYNGTSQNNQQCNQSNNNNNTTQNTQQSNQSNSNNNTNQNQSNTTDGLSYQPSSNADTYSVNGLAENKQKIMAQADKMGATNEEKAALLANANIETEDMDANAGDHSKSGDAANYGLYNMNAEMIQKYGNYNGDLNALNNDEGLDTEVALNTMRNMGIDNYLKALRGGASGLNGSLDVSDYKETFMSTYGEYLNNPELMTNDQRVKEYVQYI